MRLSTILKIIRQTLSFKFEQQTILCVQKGFPRFKEGSVRRGSSFLEPPDCRPYQRFEKPNSCVKCDFAVLKKLISSQNLHVPAVTLALTSWSLVELLLYSRRAPRYLKASVFIDFLAINCRYRVGIIFFVRFPEPPVLNERFSLRNVYF